MTTSTLLPFEQLVAINRQHFLENVQTFVKQQSKQSQKKETDFKEWFYIVQQLITIAKKQQALQNNNDEFCLTVAHSNIGYLSVSENMFFGCLKQFILEHINEIDLNVIKISKALGLSRSQLHRKSKALTNLSITQLVNVIKINIAKNLLLTSDLTVSEIAYQCGFQSLSYFSKVFNKMIYCSPTAYRKEGEKLLMQQ